MRDGMFAVNFQGPSGAGTAVLVFEEGRVYGFDAMKVRYDGVYVFDERTGLVEATVKVTFPSNVLSVYGIMNPYEWSIDVTATFDPRTDDGPFTASTSVGVPLTAQFTYMRALPEAA